MAGSTPSDESQRDRYFLPVGYEPNRINVTMDAVSGVEYWNDERVALSGRYQRRAYELAARRARTDGRRRIVDVGCGVATKLTECFDDDSFELMGVDQASAVAACERLGRRGEYVADDFEQPSTATQERIGSADMVISSDVIEHLLDPDPLVEYVRTICADDGLIVLTTPDRGALCGATAMTPSNAAHVREWEREEFTAYLRSRGLDVIESQLVRPFSFRFDRMTIAWVVKRLLRRMPLRTCHMVVCRLAR